MQDGRLIFALSVGVELSYAEKAFAESLRRDLVRRRQVTVGVRPHAVRIADNGDNGIVAEVLANQWLGDQSHIVARLADTTIVSVIHHRSKLSKGTPISILIASDELHIFDTLSGLAISHGGQQVAT